MKNATAAQKELPRQNHAPLLTKLGLALFFVLGIAIIVLGISGQRAYDTSGFSAESAYSAVYSLHKDVASVWEKQLKPQLSALPEDKRTLVDEAARALLDAAWESQSAGGAAEVETILSGGAEKERLTYQLLYATWSMGPR